jgi:hypothetical protein
MHDYINSPPDIFGKVLIIFCLKFDFNSPSECCPRDSALLIFIRTVVYCLLNGDINLII